MRCSDFESLIDAYLDGELSGTLRIEFDVHRLRCRHCQQSVAMMEALGDVVAHDAAVPPLSPGFSDRVLARLESRAQPGRRWAARIWLGAYGGLTAAAVLGLALITLQPASDPGPQVHSAHSTPRTWLDSPVAPAGAALVSKAAAVAGAAGQPVEEGHRAEVIRALIMEKLNDRVWDAYAGGAALSNDFLRLASYLNINLPEDLARDSIHLSSINPLMSLLQAIVPTASAEETDVTNGDDVYIL